MKNKKQKRVIKIVIVDEEAYWIVHLFSWVASGKSARSWCFYANTNGFTSRQGSQGVTTQQVSKWLRNPIYKGEYQWNKTTMRSGQRTPTARGDHITIPCPPIVSTDLWQRVQDRLKVNRRYSSGNAKHFYLLRGLLECKECGKSFMGGTSNRRYYECYGTRTYPHRHQCRHPHRIKADVLEKYCWGEIADHIDMSVSESDLVGYLVDELHAQTAESDKNLQRVRDALSRCAGQRQIIATRER
ncbi:recombinase family protein, partial [Chloroflexota bacterium]